MKIAIMQPYLFPYIGYFQLINAVDVFGIGDDVQYIEGGWINRNRLMVNKSVFLYTFPLKKDSYKKAIKDRYFHENFNYKKEKYLKMLNYNYKKAPYFSETIKLVTLLFEYQETNISKFIENQLKVICEYLKIETSFINSKLWKIDIVSGKNVEERAVEKLKMLKELGMDHFINPIGGKKLYSKYFFEKNYIKLSYLESKEISYKQFGQDFIPNLSIIDVMMFNSSIQIRKMLDCCNIV